MHFVYLLVSKNKNRTISYVGYAKDINKRLKLHNKSKGAKFTKGRTWIVIYFKKYRNKTTAMKEEFKLKKNYKLRNKIKEEYLEKNENCNITSF